MDGQGTSLGVVDQKRLLCEIELYNMNLSSDFEENEGYPIVEFESDENINCDSSEDEVEVILHGTPQQKRRLVRRSLGHDDQSSEDEFEKAMEAELQQTVNSLESRFKIAASSAGTSQQPTSENDDCYANDYFDSSSDEEGTCVEKAQRQHPRVSNDDLLYDPDLDDEDQRWVDSNRARCQPTNSGPRRPKGSNERKRKSEQISKLPNSDAVLNCPACMSLLCRDCQRHSIYNSQYRAMFVSNCRVEMEETLKYPVPQQSGKAIAKKGVIKERKRRAREMRAQDATSEQEGAFPVSKNVTDATSCQVENTSEAKDTSTVSEIQTLGKTPTTGSCKSENRGHNIAVNLFKCVNTQENSDNNDNESMVTDTNNMLGNAVCSSPVKVSGKMAKNTTDISQGQASQHDCEVYHPVKCEVCSTVVGVFDSDQVVHFFNVLASY